MQVFMQSAYSKRLPGNPVKSAVIQYTVRPYSQRMCDLNARFLMLFSKLVFFLFIFFVCVFSF